MKKILLLSKMLSRGSSEGDKKTDENADVFNIFMIIVLAGATFCAGMFLTPISCNLIPNSTIASLFVIISIFASLIRVFPMVINGLFMSKDVEVLLTLPFSSLQLALSNSINIIKTIGLYVIAATIPFALGIFVGESGDIVNILLIDILFIIFVPVFAAFTIILLSTLIMKCLKTMANKEFQKVLGVICGAVLLIAITIFNITNNNQGHITQLDNILSIINNISGFTWVIPVVPLIHDFIFEKNILNIIFVLLIDVGVVALSFLTLNAFYLQILKQVTNTFSNTKAVSEKTIEKASKGNNIISAMTKKDLKLIFRDSGYYMNCIISPVILSGFFSFLFYQSIEKFLNAGQVEGQAIITSIVCGISIGLMLSTSLTALSGVASCSFSREGHSIIFIKQLPITFKSQINAKRNVALIMSVPLGILIMLVLSTIGILNGIFTWVTPIFAILVFITSTLFFVYYSIFIDLKKPNLYATKLNKITQPKVSITIIAIILVMISLLLPIAITVLPVLATAFQIEINLVNIISYAVIIIIPVAFIILTFITSKRLNNKGEFFFNKL